MPELSPSAKAVDDAYWKTINNKWNIYDRHRAKIAAALRVAVEQCTYRDAWEDKFLSAERILAIADELETNV